ncbi:MAG TPA: exonuclease, partial [Bacteroidales bacterium]|nr:exonuclease [Bacteroidales bacterium]
RLDLSNIELVPDEPGIYYFYNEQGDLIYIGKSRNLQQRISTHLSNNTTARAMEMRDLIADISWDVTGNELIALLRESHEIKENKPFYNRAQRRSSFQWGIYTSEDKNGYICLSLHRVTCDENPISVFTSRERARSKLESLVENYNLCQKLAGLYECEGPCFRHHVGICRGACCGKEIPKDYNIRVLKAMDEFVFSRHNFFIIDRGRNDEEKSAVKIFNGKYAGYGYFNVNDMGFGLDAVHDCIKSSPDNRDIQCILKQYLRNNRVEKIIEF